MSRRRSEEVDDRRGQVVSHSEHAQAMSMVELEAVVGVLARQFGAEQPDLEPLVSLHGVVEQHQSPVR